MTTKKRHCCDKAPIVTADSTIGMSYGMNFRQPSAEKRWQQILASVHADIPRNRRQLWPYDICDAASVQLDWAPCTDREKEEAECLKDLCLADRVETIKIVLEKWDTTLERILHLYTKKQVKHAQAWARLIVAIKAGKIKSPPLFQIPDLKTWIYAWKYITMQQDTDEKAQAAKKRNEDRKRRNCAKIATERRQETSEEVQNILRAIAAKYQEKTSNPTLNSAAKFIRTNWNSEVQMHDYEYSGLFADLISNRNNPLSAKQITRHIRVLWPS